MGKEQLDALRPYAFCAASSGAHNAVIGMVGRDKRVLDLGCSTGYLAEKFRGNGCFVVGVEQDEESAHQAQGRCDRLIRADVEEVFSRSGFSAGDFDVIVCADILEHLRDPAALLVRARSCLSEGGRIIVSVPNVARADIRLKLLFGRFDYEEAGIMDKTHLHFFTCRSACRLVAEAGYRVSRVQYTGMAARIRLFPGLLSFQFVIEAFA